MDKPSCSSRYVGPSKHTRSSLLVLRPDITPDAETKFGHSNCNFEQTVNSRDEELKSWSGTKERRGIG